MASKCAQQMLPQVLLTHLSAYSKWDTLALQLPFTSSLSFKYLSSISFVIWFSDFLEISFSKAITVYFSSITHNRCVHHEHFVVSSMKLELGYFSFMQHSGNIHNWKINGNLVTSQKGVLQIMAQDYTKLPFKGILQKLNEWKTFLVPFLHCFSQKDLYHWCKGKFQPCHVL